MRRRILEVLTLDKIEDVVFPEPVRLVFLPPDRGGPPVAAIRSALASQGRLRLSASPGRLFADLDPGTPEPPVLALDTIVRSDAAGLERMLRSVLPHVDEIVLGVDGRSDEATLKIAKAYGDCVFVFEGADIGLSPEAWTPSETNPRGKINFAAARNLGRARVRAPWVLVIDSDEYLETSVDIRATVAAAPPEVGAFFPLVRVVEGDQSVFESGDHQRLARAKYRWTEPVHNQLICADSAPPPKIDVVIISDPSIRAEAEQAAREAQRGIGVDASEEAALNGNLNAYFHLAKHRIGTGELADAVRLVEDFRLRCEPNSILGWKRQWLALGLAFRFYTQENNSQEANRWAVRALLDGPSIAAFALLGDIAEDEGDLLRALAWYECACAVSDNTKLVWPRLTNLRWGRLAGLRLALSSPEATAHALALLKGEATDDAEPDSVPGASETAPTSGT
jgi:glycosyltransferase involved in cell wall biosynthesis